jgi:hypothetical protein
VAARRGEAIPETLTRVFERSRADDVATEVAARQVADERIAAVGGLRGFWLRS